MPLNNRSYGPNLIAFDVDHTLINGHSHNFLARIQVKAPYSGNSLIVNGELQLGGYKPVENEDYDINSVANMMFPFLENDETGLKDQKAISDTFTELLNSGNKIAITSFTQYPDAVEILLDRLNLTQVQRNSIIVVTGFPPTKAGRDDPERKNYHIKAAMKLAGITDPTKVMLVDDDRKNITKATEAGYQTVFVPKTDKTAEYLSEVAEKARAMGSTAMDRQQSKESELVYENLPQQQNVPPPLSPRSPAGDIRRNLEQQHNRPQPKVVQTTTPSDKNKPVDRGLSQQPSRDDNKSHKQAPRTLASVIKELYPKDAREVERSFRELVKNRVRLDNGDIRVPINIKGVRQQKQRLKEIFTKVGAEVDYNEGNPSITVKDGPEVKEFLNKISLKNEIPPKKKYNFKTQLNNIVDFIRRSLEKHKGSHAHSTPNSKTKTKEHSR